MYTGCIRGRDGFRIVVLFKHETTSGGLRAGRERKLKQINLSPTLTFNELALAALLAKLPRFSCSKARHQNLRHLL